MKELQVISMSHHQFPLETIGQFHIPDHILEAKLQDLKNTIGCEELMFVSTCNRVEWIFTVDHYVCSGLTQKILDIFKQSDELDIPYIVQNCLRLTGEEAVNHALRTASSLNSAVIGEHEILGQMRAAYDYSLKQGLAGETLRILMKQCIKSSKQVFTETDLRRKPVSIVSIAWSAFQEQNIPTNSVIGLVGAGQIIGTFAKFLEDAGYTNIHVFNRSIENASEIANRFSNGVSHGINEFYSCPINPTAWVICTGSTEYLMNEKMIDELSSETKFIVDLAMPGNVHHSIKNKKDVGFFDMNSIQKITSENIAFREQALEQCEPIILSGLLEHKHMVQERKIELAMQNIPTTIKEIRDTAVGSVFHKELASLDEEAKATLDRILDYMEKKYISVPMKMAKAVLLEHQKN
ncbi:MAG: glutamyl-tRNA reductase [Bacteroidota bacterium]